MDKHDGEVPRERKALEALPEVGRKTANEVLNTALPSANPPWRLNAHLRVANRTGLAPGRTPQAVEQALLKRPPAEYLRHAHHWLILHGRYTPARRASRCAAFARNSTCAISRTSIATCDASAVVRKRSSFVFHAASVVSMSTWLPDEAKGIYILPGPIGQARR